MHYEMGGGGGGGQCDGLVGEVLNKCGGLGMMCLVEQLYGMRKLFLGIGERALLLMCLRKG